MSLAERIYGRVVHVVRQTRQFGTWLSYTEQSWTRDTNRRVELVIRKLKSGEAEWKHGLMAEFLKLLILHFSKILLLVLTDKLKNKVL